MNLDGTDIQFTKGEIESPSWAQLAFDGDTIYGATWSRFRPTPSDPPVQGGKLFSIKPDGSEYQSLLDLDFDVTSLDVSNDTIYGIQDTFSGIVQPPALGYCFR